MLMDKASFFREASIRVCGSLEIEESLWRCFLHVRNYIPAEVMLLAYLDKERGGQRFLAEATEEGGRLIDLLIPQPVDVLELMASDRLPEIMIVHGPDKHPVLKAVLGVWERATPNSSVLVVRLIVDDHLIGAAMLWNSSPEVYSRDHADLFFELKEPMAIALSNSLRHRELLRLKELLAEDNRYLQDELMLQAGDEIVGSGFGLKGVMEMVQNVAPLESPVLLLGETGVGKELIANAIHSLSPRRQEPFIKVNCGAIPETLVDSELFGHEKGAFTGAISHKRGRFERAHGGTLFLDEVGELSPEVQIRLLRVLQEKEIERVGGQRPINVDVRIIAATHRDLEDLIDQEKFRPDLYFRLNVFPIVIPPLRERPGDIPALVQHFISKKAREIRLSTVPRLAHDALDRLLEYEWPGNIRELENAIERGLILSPRQPLRFSDLGIKKSKTVDGSVVESALQRETLNEVMTRHILKVLDMSDGRVEGKEGAAEILGINPATLRKRMKKLGIPFGRKAPKTRH